MQPLPANASLHAIQGYVRKLEAERGSAGRPANLGGEAVDVLLMLISIVNRYDIDLEEAFRAKEERNNARHWR